MHKSNIVLDNHAIRFGEEPAGYIVIAEWLDKDYLEKYCVDNKFFVSLSEALDFAKSFNDNFKVIIKSLRKYNDNSRKLHN
jgi:hypothetical protein